MPFFKDSRASQLQYSQISKKIAPPKMTLLVRKIPSQLTFNNLYKYFSKYGRINDFRIINDTATLQYDSFSVEKDVFHDRHELNGFQLFIEKDRGMEECSGTCAVHCSRKRNSYPKERSYDRYSHPNDINKIVIENIPVCNPLELKDFVRDLNLDPVYSRITNSGKFGIIEFRSIEAKNLALKELDGISFKSHRLTCRPYFNRERRDSDSNYRREPRESNRDEQNNFKDEPTEKTEECNELRDWNDSITRGDNQ